MLGIIRNAAIGSAFVLLLIFPSTSSAGRAPTDTEVLRLILWPSATITGVDIPENVARFRSHTLAQGGLTQVKVEELLASFDQDNATQKAVHDALQARLDLKIASLTGDEKDALQARKDAEVLTLQDLRDVLTFRPPAPAEGQPQPQSIFHNWENAPAGDAGAPARARATALKNLLVTNFQPGSADGGNGAVDNPVAPIHGGTPGDRDQAELHPKTNKIWDALSDAEKARFPGGKAQLDRLLKQLDNTDFEGRYDAAAELAHRLPQNKLQNWLRASNDWFGFPPTDARANILKASEWAANASNKDLYARIFDESRTAEERKAAQEVFNKRLTPYDDDPDKEIKRKKFTDFAGSTRPGLIQYYSNGIDDLTKLDDEPALNAEAKKTILRNAADGFATLLGPVNDLDQFNDRNGSEYDDKLKIAADLAKKIRSGQIKLTNADGQINWANIEGYDENAEEDDLLKEFKNEFVKKYLLVHKNNVKFNECTDIVANQGPSNSRFAECRSWLQANYSGANVSDFVNANTGDGTNGAQNSRAANAVLAIAGEADENGIVSIEVDVNDHNAVQFAQGTGGQTTVTNPTRRMRLALGVTGTTPEARAKLQRTTIAALNAFNTGANNRPNDPFGFPGFDIDAGRLGSTGFVAAGRTSPANRRNGHYYVNGDGLQYQALPFDKPKAEGTPDTAIPGLTTPAWVPQYRPPQAQPRPGQGTNPGGNGPGQGNTPRPVATVFGANTQINQAQFNQLTPQQQQTVATAVGNGGACIACHTARRRGPTSLAAMQEGMKDWGDDTRFRDMADYAAQAGRPGANPAVAAALRAFADKLGEPSGD